MRNSHKKAMILKYRLILMIKVANSGLHYALLWNYQSTTVNKYKKKTIDDYLFFLIFKFPLDSYATLTWFCVYGTSGNSQLKWQLSWITNFEKYHQSNNYSKTRI